jgi:hypothetical protein
VAREDDVRKLAYQIWETAGRPDGHAADHWLEAERQLARSGLVAAAAKPVTVEQQGTAHEKLAARRAVRRGKGPGA